MRLTPVMASLCTLGLVLGCGGTTASSPDPGTLTLKLGSDSLPGYQQAWVTVGKVEGSYDNVTWTVLATPNQSLDLMALQNGHPVTLVDQLSVPPGTYNGFRITWSATSSDPAKAAAYLVDSTGTSRSLAMPTGGTTTVPASVQVVSLGSATAQIMLSGTQAVQPRVAGATFQATGQGCNLGNCATVTGHLSAGTTPLSGVEVFAESLDGSFTASIQRRALTDSLGAFKLEALPIGASYYLVTQPAGTGPTYGAQASAAISAAAVTTYGPFDLDFAALSAPAPGTLGVTLTPASLATDATWAELRQSLTPGGTGFPQALIVRSQPVATGASQDTASFPGLYPGTGLYGVTVQRSSAGAAPVTKSSASPQSVAAGATTAVTLTLP